MGASQWGYATPYQADIHAALQDLRQKTFRAGAYYTPTKFQEQLLKDVPRLPLGMRLRAQIAVLRGRFQSPPQSIHELIERNGEEGTHSILDIEAVSDTPQFGTVSPLRDHQLVDIFGTTKPTLAMVTDKLDACCSLRSRWEGLYIVAYEADTPTHICFAGFSGD
jgi:hypothetical protein